MPYDGAPAILGEYVDAFGVARDSRRPKVSVKPARIHTWDDAMRTTVVRTVGFRWRCSCGAFGKVRSTPDVARGEGREHEAGHDA